MQNAKYKSKRLLSILLILVTVFGLFATLPHAMGAPAEPYDSGNHVVFDSTAEFGDDRVIIKTNPNYRPPWGILSSDPYGGLEIEESVRLDMPKKGGVIQAESEESQIILLILKDKGRDAVIDAVNYLNSLPNIEIAEPDFIIRANDISTDPYDLGMYGIPNDPFYPDLWGMDRINAPAVWDLNIDCSSVVVAVIDSGIDYTHPDLAANIWVNPNPGQSGFANDIRGWNFVSDNNNVMDDNGHGTHVAGTIGAVGNNGIGVSGVALNV